MNWSSQLWKPPEAVELAINKCIADGILANILRVHRKEVSAMYLEEYDEERHKRTIREEGYEDGFEAGKATGFEAGKTSGFEAGQTAGIETGENRINTLNGLLLKDNRQEDLVRAVSDAEFRKKLLKEYGL